MSWRALWVIVTNRQFFPGTIATANSIRHYHPDAEIAVVSSGEGDKALSTAQRQLLCTTGVTVYSPEHFDKPGRVLEAWQLKAYAAHDLANGIDMVIGMDSDAVLCSKVDDIIQQSLTDGKMRGGRDGSGTTYGHEYGAYGFAVPARNPKYMSTSLYFVPLNKINRQILREWASCCDKACFGPQAEKLYPGHGDQGVLNAVIWKRTRSANVELLENQLFSQHWTYFNDIIHCEDGRLLNATFGNAPMRALHCGGTHKFWSAPHSNLLPASGQNQTWSYAHWLRMLWFGVLTDWTLDPYQWLAPESRHLCRDLVHYYHQIEVLDRNDVRRKWEKMSDALLTRITDGIPRFMSIGTSMSQYIALAKHVPDGGSIAEVGGYLGGSTVTLAVAVVHKGVRITSIESFLGNLDGKVDGRKLPSPKEYLSNVKGRFPHLNIATLHLDSMNASRKFGDGSLDMVFIDGNHSTDSVAADIEAWFPKLRPNGILAGDDISWESVKAAVQKRFAANYQMNHGVWWVVAPVAREGQ